MKKKKDKSFWLTAAAIACIVLYILIPLTKILLEKFAGISFEYNTTLTSALILIGAALYIAGRREYMKTREFKSEAAEEALAAEEIVEVEELPPGSLDDGEAEVDPDQYSSRK